MVPVEARRSRETNKEARVTADPDALVLRRPGPTCWREKTKQKTRRLKGAGLRTSCSCGLAHFKFIALLTYVCSFVADLTYCAFETMMDPKVEFVSVQLCART